MPAEADNVQLVADQVAPSGARYTSGFIVQRDLTSAADLESQYDQAVTTSKREVLELVAQDLGVEPMSDQARAALMVEWQDQKALLRELLQGIGSVSRVLVTLDTVADVDELRTADKISFVTELGGAQGETASSAAAECSEDSVYWATKGYISSQESVADPGSRYVQQRFLWTQEAYDNLLSCDGANTSYEPDAFYNNNDGEIYLGNTLAWEASFFGAYLDSQFLDDPSEKQYTVGAGRVSEMAPGVNYRTYIRTTAGDAERDSAKVQGQRGRNDCPGNRVDTLCVLDSSATHALVAAWRHPAPGATPWGGYGMSQMSSFTDDNQDVFTLDGHQGLDTPNVDIREYGLRNTSTQITLQIRMDDPDGPLRDRTEFWLDLTGRDTFPDFGIADSTYGDTISFRVRDLREGNPGVYICDATSTYAAPYYRVTFPAACIGSPKRLYVRARYMLFLTGAGKIHADVVPNTFPQWDGPVAR